MAVNATGRVRHGHRGVPVHLHRRKGEITIQVVGRLKRMNPLHIIRTERGIIISFSWAQLLQTRIVSIKNILINHKYFTSEVVQLPVCTKMPSRMLGNTVS